MKYLSFLLPACFLLINTPAFTQNTTTWFPPGAKWSYLSKHFAPASDGEEFLELVGHETVGGELCAKLHDYGVDDFWGFLLPFDKGFRYLFARNDSVFLWDNNSFNLLYDFNRIAGDTFSVSNGIYDHGLVLDIGEEVWNGIPVRFQDLRLSGPPFSPGGDSLYLNTRIYERLGGTHLLYWDIESPLTEVQYDLVCYSDEEYPQTDCPLGYDPTYTPFPQFGTGVWSERNGGQCGYRGYQYKVEHDTAIAGIGHGKKVYFRNTYAVSFCSNPTTEIFHEPFRLIGLLDQDILHKKVYFARIVDDPAAFSICTESDSLPLNEYHLLYDFDLKAGDTVAWKSYPNVVQAIDSIQLDNGTWRRTFVFEPNPNNPFDTYYWIEGIGSDRGLFGAFANTTVTDIGCHLQCFRYNNPVIYSTVDAVFCDSVAVATHEPHSLDKLLQLYPNPSSGKITLEIPQSETPADLRVFDLQGRELGQLEAPEAQNDLDLSIWKNYPALFVQIRGVAGHYAGRVVLLE